MVRTNLQEFGGDVHVLSNLQVGSNLFANDLAANVLTVIGSIGANIFIGDGGLLSNIATTLNDIVANPGGNTVSNTLVFESGADATSNTAIATLSNVGISISNTEPSGEFQFAVGSNIFVNTHASNVLTVVGAIGSDLFIGDGGLLSNIATTLDQIVDQGNTVSNTLVFESGADATSNTCIVTKKDVGISISNTEPTGEFQFGVGSNLLVNVYSSNVLAIEGNVSAEKMTLGTISVTSAYGLNHVTAQGSVTGDTISLTNATTGLEVTSNLTAGGNVTAETVITSANVEVGNRLKFASNVFVDDLRVADLAANLVTYDKTTGELMDSGGLFANKLAVVSVQPPSALSANTTTIAKHGTYTVTTSGLESTSNAWNAFDGAAVEWKSIFIVGRLYDAGGSYTGPTRLATTTKQGEWLAIEFPYKTTLRHMKLTPPATIDQYPASANVYATNDSLTWTEVVNWSGVNPVTSSNVQTITVNATEAYKKYAMVVTESNGGNDNVALAKWELFTESFSIDGGKVAMASSAVMGGETTVDQHGPHSRLPKAMPLRKYPERVKNSISKNQSPIGANTFVYRNFTLSSSTTYASINHTISNAIDDHEDTAWSSAQDYDATSGNPTSIDFPNGHYIQLELPNKIRLKNTMIRSQNSSNFYNSPKNVKIYGSNDGLSWTLIKTATNLPLNGPSLQTTIDVDSTNYYKYHRLEINSIYRVGGNYGRIAQWELYGYEEDPPLGDTSVDTTFTSIMNTPQTTGANVYVDGNLGETFTNRVTGPTVSNTHTTYVSAGKYWELSGNVESNVTVEANTFLEGDQPHAVSVWFNSSNLEANVSNTCVFSISDQEHLNSQNLDLQSNTWHNLTYAYQGEGGSRVTYLDGRKVAEDQAEDTFGDYPPFAMTGYSQGGYVVSASNEDTANDRHAWNMFGAGYWFTNAGTFATSGSYDALGGDTFIDTGGVSHTGHWLKLNTPFRFTLNWVDLFGPNSSNQPDSYVILGSGNDGVTWDLLYTETGYSMSSGTNTNSSNVVPPIDHDYAIVNAQKRYNTFLFVFKSLIAAGGKMHIKVDGFYGHRENDLVRLPDPTRVLKYPHIAMTGPAQRGYVASASSNYAAFNPWEAFDNLLGTTPIGSTSNYWSALSANYNVTNASTLGFGGGTGATVTTNVEGVSKYGEWLQIEFPRKVKYSYSIIRAPPDHEERQPRDGYIVGSNDLTGQWTTLHRFEDVTRSGVDDDVTYTPPSAPTQYFKYFRIVIEAISTGGGSYAGINKWDIYGTEEATPVPIQIGGGNIDKVANFRVYDKFIDENQALEIWDAQKDEFGRAKSSMTLQKGRLGIGTTEPEGRLAVLDEPHNLEEFPPRPMTGFETHVEGHGVFKASASTEQNTTTTLGWHVFAKISDNINKRWRSNSSVYDNTVNPATTNSATATFDGIGVRGEWILLEMPYNICLKKYEFVGFLTQTPHTGQIWGSDDNGTTWHHIDTFENAVGVTSYPSPTNAFHVLGNTKYYSKYVFIVEKLTSADDAASMSSLKYFGTREQGQSVLHDGALTLTKNLTVPRIGPALDADDTPRRDRLVVEYNTSTNPTFEGAVRDTSGRGNDGVFYGGASYDATEKAFDTPNTTGIIRKNINLPGGNIPLSVSAWFRLIDTTTSTNDTIICLGTNSDATSGGSFILRVNTDQLRINFEQSDNYTEFTKTISLGRWYHVVATYDGGTSASGRKLFIDGVEIAQTSTTATITGVNLPANPDFTVGMRTDISGYINGFISNFKLYDTALTAEEAKTLYDMGRCDEGHHVVNFSKTRVGIGLGDGEAPRAALDVRGDILGGCPAAFSVAYNPTSLSGPQTIVWNLVYHNVGGGYDSSDGLFTAPVSGYYSFTVWGMTSSGTSGTVEFQFIKNGSTVQQRPYGQAGGNYGNATGSIIEYLSAGDTMNVRLTSGTTLYASSSQSYNGFSGFYLSS